MDLSGKTALVTGGSQGLGRAMASAFHSAGANVALLARRDGPLKDAQKEIEENGP
ncbi:MAG: SDR family NAD(P)-dependent oxidoreductase, partial [Pseudomonadales bacterium]|nr:SDR family NAD(P)-dependent oxidoreductase [Pseudomonadales bacterium]